MLIKYIRLCVDTRYQAFQGDCPSLPVSWSWSRSSLSEKGGVLGLCFLSLCSPCPRSLPYTGSLHWVQAFGEAFGESRSWCLDTFSQFRVRWLPVASLSSNSVLRSTSPLILGRGGLRGLSWPHRFLSRCSVLIWGSSLTLPELEDRHFSDEWRSSSSSKFSSGCLGFSFLCFTVFSSFCSFQGLENPGPSSLALLDRGWSEWGGGMWKTEMQVN